MAEFANPGGKDRFSRLEKALQAGLELDFRVDYTFEQDPPLARITFSRQVDRKSVV